MNRERSRLNRRSMLMALGAGSSVALTGPYGAASAQEGDAGDDGDGNEGDGGPNGRQCPPCIDPYAGYLQVGEVKGEQPLGSIDPVTTVEMRVTDADVVFPEDEQLETETTATGTATNETEVETTPTVTPATETPNETVNETVETTVPETEATNETIEAANETIAGETDNETMETDNETIAGETEPANETGMPGGESQEIPDFYFDPVGIHLQPGDTVEFLIKEELHTVTAFHPRFGFQQRVPDGVPGFTSPPFLPDDSWYYRFDEPGVYDMLCLPHLGLGMVMRAVVVDDETDEIPEAYPDPDPEAEEAGIPPIALRVLNAPELDPQNIVEQGPIQWTDLSEVAAEPPTGF